MHWPRGGAVFMERNSRDFASRISSINVTPTRAVAETSPRSCRGARWVELEVAAAPGALGFRHLAEGTCGGRRVGQVSRGR